jgi:type IV pilus assembly protein PilW
MRSFSIAAPRRARGFSLVEVMVAMLIGLIGTIVIFQTFAVSESQRRTTTGGGDAQQNGLLALAGIERDARLSGFGINYSLLYGCTTNLHDEGPPIRNTTFSFLPVVIADGASGAPDTLTFVYGSSNKLVAPAKLLVNTAINATSLRVDNQFGFLIDDVLITGQVGTTCSTFQTTAVNTDTLTLGSGNYVNSSGGTSTARYNNATGATVAYSAWDDTTSTGTRVFNLGSSPQVATYSVSNGQLMFQNLFTDSASTAIIDGIVQVQAQYGKDTNADGAVDLWTEAMPLTPTATDWSNNLAIRVAVVARSSLPEKPNPTTNLCDTTPASPTWLGGTIDLSADPNWKCYRYRVFQTVIPLRNVLWAPL